MLYSGSAQKVMQSLCAKATHTIVPFYYFNFSDFVFTKTAVKSTPVLFNWGLDFYNVNDSW